MAEKPTETPAHASEKIRVAKISGNRVTLEFQIEDLVQQLAQQVQAANCMGCKGCMAARF